jgi:hypothetical protein
VQQFPAAKVPYFEDAVGGGYVESSIHWTNGGDDSDECHTVFVPVTIAHTPDANLGVKAA